MNKVILISIDGMRPDGLTACGNPFVKTMMEKGSYAMDARTVMPSVTLPCHMSMFHSVPPERHGITTNLYMPQVRPVNGIMEQVKMQGGKALEEVSILDIAPTVAAVMGIPAAPEWEGKARA